MEEVSKSTARADPSCRQESALCDRLRGGRADDLAPFLHRVSQCGATPPTSMYHPRAWPSPTSGRRWWALFPPVSRRLAAAPLSLPHHPKPEATPRSVLLPSLSGRAPPGVLVSAPAVWGRAPSLVCRVGTNPHLPFLAVARPAHSLSLCQQLAPPPSCRPPSLAWRSPLRARRRQS